MHNSSSRHQNADKENIPTSNIQENNVRITRSRAKALGSPVAFVPPSKPSFKQEPDHVLRVSHKRIASDDNKASTTAASGFQHKRRAVLKDVTNTSENIYSNCLKGRNVKASKRGRKETKEIAKEDADAPMAILVDVDAEKSKLAEDLSKIRMAEPRDASVPNSKDRDISLQNMNCRVRESKEEDTSSATDCVQVVDIDSNVKDPQSCSLYAPDIFHNIRVAELEQRPLTNYMEKVQRDINPSMRGILVDWLVEVAEEYKLVPDTLYLTVNLIDRFLSHNYIEKNRLQLLGVTCMLIASKYEEICAPRVEEFCFITDNTFTRQEVLNMEIQVLNFLHYQLSVPTTKTFLRRFVQAAQASYKVPRIELEFLANYLAELTLLEYNFLGFQPSLIAASAVFLARWILDQSDHPWVCSCILILDFFLTVPWILFGKKKKIFSLMRMLLLPEPNSAALHQIRGTWAKKHSTCNGGFAAEHEQLPPQRYSGEIQTTKVQECGNIDIPGTSLVALFEMKPKRAFP